MDWREMNRGEGEGGGSSGGGGWGGGRGGGEGGQGGSIEDILGGLPLVDEAIPTLRAAYCALNRP